jgi:hypothetical protein
MLLSRPVYDIPNEAGNDFDDPPGAAVAYFSPALQHQRQLFGARMGKWMNFNEKRLCRSSS